MRRSGSSTAPIVVNERTVTLRARTWSVPIQIGDTRAVYVRARPDHVEVLEPDGRHVTIRVHNINAIAHRAIIAGAFAVTLATRMRRRKDLPSVAQAVSAGAARGGPERPRRRRRQ